MQKKKFARICRKGLMVNGFDTGELNFLQYGLQGSFNFDLECFLGQLTDVDRIITLKKVDFFQRSAICFLDRGHGYMPGIIGYMDP